MNRSLLAILFSLSALSLSACGGGHDKLTDAQKAEVKDFTRTTAKLKGVTTDVGNDTKAFASMAATSPKNNFENYSDDENLVQLSDLIERAIEQGKCGDPKKFATASASEGYFAVKLEGANCPLSLSASGKMGASADKTSIKADMSMKLIDPELLKLSDISEVQFSINADGNEDGGSGELNAEIVSQKKGRIKLAISAKGSADKAKVTVEMTFPTFVAEFKIEGDEKSHKIELNGEKITDEQFHDYMSGLEKQFNQLQ